MQEDKEESESEDEDAAKSMIFTRCVLVWRRAHPFPWEIGPRAVCRGLANSARRVQEDEKDSECEDEGSANSMIPNLRAIIVIILAGARQGRMREHAALPSF